MGSSKTKNSRFQSRTMPDWHLWNEVTRSISPLSHQQHSKRKPQITAKPLSSAEQSQLRHLAAQTNRKTKSQIPPAWTKKNDDFTPNPFYASQHTHLPNMEPRIHRRVRRGQVLIDATIDLHGMHQRDARVALHRFVATRQTLGDRTLLIITGKGLKKTGFGQIEQRGVLRHMLPVWLKEPQLAPLIAGFETSARHHGGEGAYYVRLKRARQ